MALFKCKMCGGALEINQNDSITTCEYCGTQQTLPKLNDERRTNLYDRANHFRRNNEFDKAMGIYEQILTDDNTDAEAYWSLVLCRYGIEYVEDPSSHKRIPTVNRAQYTSVFDDDNYKSALQYADGYQRHIYEEEAKAINEIQKGILAISQKEEPFDVFICYKETDNNGRRTPDSVLANELYHQLTQEGFKVFFSRITLEDKLGSAYEPYIFAALNSAKVMVVLGTRPEYFKAVWVRNEWSRYLSLIKQGQKKMLIPAYKDMDPYDLPDEFSHLQAQDMSKLGFMQDLIRGIKKIIGSEESKTTVIKETVVTGGNANVAPLLKRVFMFLEDEDWDSADEYCEKVLDIDPENAQAYLGKLMVSLEVTEIEELKECDEPFDDEINYRKIMRFGDAELKNTMMGYIEHINARNELARLESIYTRAQAAMQKATNQKEFLEASQIFASVRDYKDAASQVEECRAKAEIARLEDIYSRAEVRKKSASTEDQYIKAAELYETIPEYKDSVDQTKFCREKAEITRKDSIYMQADALMYGVVIANYEVAKELLQSIPGWKDSDDLVLSCERTIGELKTKEEADRLEAERKAEEERRERKITTIVGLITCVAVEAVTIWYTVIVPNNKYNDAIELIDTGNIVEAYEILSSLGEYKDSAEKAESIYEDYKLEKLKNPKVGDFVFFGKYEQDNNEENGKEKIEWLVLEVKGGRALLISKDALDCEPYNIVDQDVTWGTCTLRNWLNDSFVNAAFSADERAMIPTVTVSANKNPEYGTNPGNDTKDKVFLLNITEVNKYFESDSARLCKATEYTIVKGAHIHESFGYVRWWLRSPGYKQDYAAYVYDDGGVEEHGINVYYDNRAVRPALWITLPQ